MTVDNEDIKKVLALFDKDDIPYINLDYLVDKGFIEIVDNKEDDKGTAMKLGGKYDG